MSWAALGMQAADRLIGNLSDTYGTGKALRDDKREEEMGDYLERERRGIQSRVEGAKAAGLHPLVALGYQSGPGPSSVVGGGGLGGSYSGGGGSGTVEGASPSAQLTEDQDRMNKARVRQAEADADLAELNAHEASMKMAHGSLANQPGNPPPVIQTLPTEAANQVPGGLVKGIKVVPNEIQSSTGGQVQGVQPGAEKVNVPGYGTWNMPSKALNEKLEDAELLKILAILGLNRGKLGQFLTDDVPWAFKGYLGDLRERVGLPRSTKRGRRGGATGSW